MAFNKHVVYDVQRAFAVSTSSMGRDLSKTEFLVCSEIIYHCAGTLSPPLPSADSATFSVLGTAVRFGISPTGTIQSHHFGKERKMASKRTNPVLHGDVAEILRIPLGF